MFYGEFKVREEEDIARHSRDFLLSPLLSIFGLVLNCKVLLILIIAQQKKEAYNYERDETVANLIFGSSKIKVAFKLN